MIQEIQTIQLNGQTQKIETGTTLGKFLLIQKINPNLVACELNLKVIRRQHLNQVVLKEGDVLEIIRVMGGG